MDGFGIPSDFDRSGITLENTKNLQKLRDEFSYTTIRASEEYVGLPHGQAGTSEVGHMTIGSGRVTYQPLVKINMEIEDKKFFENKVLCDAIDYAKNNNKALHLIGMPSDGGIHSHINHLFALMDLCKKRGFCKDVYIHFIADGRDTPPKSAKTYVKQVEDYINTSKVGKLATIIGRFYALDRDKNFDRNKVAYEMWTDGVGTKSNDWSFAIDNAYNEGQTDEFLKPIVMCDEDGNAISTIKEGDCVIVYNFRADRERQLAYVMAEDNDLDFVKKLSLYFVTMTEYDETFKKVKVAYSNEAPKNLLSEVLSNNGLRQVKIAETEKYAHLTFFFNSGKQDTYSLEDRILINSEKMASYANKPEMSARLITEKALSVLDKYDFVAINFANCDMVGHSGVKSAARIATEVVDECVKKVVDEVLKRGGQGIITADHGNADIMQYPDGSPNTAHTTAIVPFILFDSENKKKKLREDGTLADIAPTLLKMMNINVPSEMTGRTMF